MSEEECYEEEDIVESDDIREREYEMLKEEFDKESWCEIEDIEKSRDFIVKWWNEIYDKEDEWNEISDKLKEKSYEKKRIYVNDIIVNEDSEVGELYAKQGEMFWLIRDCLNGIVEGFSVFLDCYYEYKDYVPFELLDDMQCLFETINHLTLLLHVHLDDNINWMTWAGSCIWPTCKILIRHLRNYYHIYKIHTDFDYYRECYYNN